MIKKKNIIILLCVLVVLCVATVVLFKWEGNDTDVSDDYNSTETIYIHNGDEAELTKMNVVIPDDEFEFVKIEDDKWQITGLEGTSIKNFSITMLADDLTKLTAKSIVEESASDLSKYGLDNPEYTITGTYGEKIKTFYAGSLTPLGD